MTNPNPPKLPSQLAAELVRQIDPSGIGREMHNVKTFDAIVTAFAPLDQLQAAAIAEALKSGIDAAAPASGFATWPPLLAQLKAALDAGAKPGEVEEFAEGDVVVPRSGGPTMTVRYIPDDDNEARCEWIDSTGQKRDEYFGIKSLFKVGR